MRLNAEQIRQRLMHRTVVFGGKELERCEMDFFEGQKATVIDVREDMLGDKEDGSDDVFVVRVDFSEFEEHNKALSRPVYYDDRNTPRLRWHETSLYPADKQDNIYIAANEAFWPFSVGDIGVIGGKVVLDAEAWRMIVEEVGEERLKQLGVRPV